MTPCQEPGAPSVWPEDWGIGLQGRAKRSQALAMCRTCSEKRDCALLALRALEAGQPPYGIWGGIAFVDVTRQEEKIERLRAVAEMVAA